MLLEWKWQQKGEKLHKNTNYGEELSPFSAASELHSPGAAEVTAALPLLQHLLTGLQCRRRTQQSLLQFHLSEEQTGSTKTHTTWSLS